MKKKRFKQWFWLMWGDNWIQLFIGIVLFALTIGIRGDKYNHKGWWIAIWFIIPLAIIAYGAFYKMWQENKDNLDDND